ncbi:MAG: sulfite exporter TauE/SafE family protein [Promethearchaeota archaeon]
MEIVFIIVLLVTGVFVGLVSGMLGVGGCFIMIPVQFWVLTAMGIDTTTAILVAFGTNLLVVFPTAISGSLRHHKKGVVKWREGTILGVTGGITAFFGALTASHIEGNVLKVAFGVAILLGSVRMITAKPIRVEGEISQNTLHYFLAGGILGYVTGLIGIGGGVLMVPVLVVLLNFHMREAVGTSTAMMIFTALGGAISYMVLGLGHPGLPAYSVGYVNLLQWVLLAGASVPMAVVGVQVAHKINQKALKWTFIVVMVYMGLKMVGLFTWLHLPI